MNEYRIFDDSPVIREITKKYKSVANLEFTNVHAVDYRMWKSSLTKQIKNNVNQKYMNTISGIPFDLNHIVLSIEFLPDKKEILKNNYDIGGFFNPKQDYITFIVNVSDNIRDQQTFVRDLKPVIVHEFFHVRQVYEAKLKNIILEIPRLSIGSTEKSLELMQKEFDEYQMHELELQAYAVEYNYRHNNTYDQTKINEFAHMVFEKTIGVVLHKDNTVRQSLQKLFKSYVNKLSDYIKKYKYTEY